MSLNYFTFVQRFAELAGTLKSDVNPTIIVPSAIEYAEQRIYRELDLQVSRVVDSSTNVSSGVRNFTLPTGSGVFLVVEQVNIITPVGTTATTSGTRVPLTAITKEYIDYAWPNAKAFTGVPTYFAPINNTTLVLGPAPDAAYNIEVIGTQRPAQLSSANSSTFLTQFLPDVFTAATMVYAATYQQGQNHVPLDPNKGALWENQYKTLMQSASIEELRKRFMGPAWQAMSPSPVATPARQ